MCIMEMNENEPLMTLQKAQMLSKLYGYAKYRKRPEEICLLTGR